MLSQKFKSLVGYIKSKIRASWTVDARLEIVDPRSNGNLQGLALQVFVRAR
jgi:hypothetical protein